MDYLEKKKLNTIDSYEFLKTFCETVPSNDTYLDNDSNSNLNLSYIPISKSIEISKFVIENISKELLTFYEEYLSNYLKLEKGNPNLSQACIVYYNETINDVYNLIHEFFHRYAYLGSYDNKDKKDMDIFYLIDEAKSIYSEEVVSHILKSNKDKLLSMNVDISNNELEELKFKRMFSERKTSSMYIYLYQLRNYLTTKDDNKRITSSDIENYFSKFDKSSVEYLSFKENFNSNIINGILERNKNFFNDGIFSTYIHPFSYLLSLKLSKEKTNLYELTTKLRSTDPKLLNDFVFKNSRLDKDSIDELKKLLEERYIDYLNYRELSSSKHM